MAPFFLIGAAAQRLASWPGGRRGQLKIFRQSACVVWICCHRMVGFADHKSAPTEVPLSFVARRWRRWADRLVGEGSANFA